MKNLENFIHMHRIEFDVYQPDPRVWAGISSGLTISTLISKLAKLLGSGSKNLIFAVVTSSAILATLVWTYQSGKSLKTNSPSVTHSTTTIIQAPENPGSASKVPLAESIKQIQASGKGPLIPTTQAESKPEIANNMQPVHSVTQPGDSFYNGVKTLNLKSFGYNFKIKLSDTKMTRVRILNQAKVIDKKTNSELVLEIIQTGSELVFQYESEDDKGGTANYKTINTGEIEILIPDAEISKITSISSNIDLTGYAAPTLNIESISGNVNASNIKARLSTGTASGNQDLAEITGDLNCDAISGNINLKNQHGNVKIETASGEISLDNCRGNITCKNISGKISLEGGQGKLDLNTASGDIKGESISLIESCNIQTISGNVEMGFQNIADDLRFNLSSISGKLKIKKGDTVTDGKGSLSFGSGKIPVTAKTVSGYQVYH